MVAPKGKANAINGYLSKMKYPRQGGGKSYGLGASTDQLTTPLWWSYAGPENSLSGTRNPKECLGGK